MRFEVLGPVRVVSDTGVPGVVSDLRRKLLAALLVRANRTLSTGLLAEILWGEDPPDRPAKSLQVHVHRLRQVLDRPDRLLGVSGGYQLQVGDDELDAAIFHRLHAEGRHFRDRADLDSAAASLRQALAIWRGAPYQNVDDAFFVSPEARRLAEARMLANEELYEAELARGRARELVPELTELVAAHPLRERFTAQLMLALYRSGRQQRAVTAYRALRRRLTAELGAEPGQELRALYDAVRGEDPALLAERTARPVVSAAPGQLPPPPGAFVGRAAELHELARIVREVDGAPVVVITGMAGVGKTGIAVRYAHSVADRFGEGQLYLDLRGHSRESALDPVDAIGRLVRGLGAEPVAVDDVDEATAQYRSLLAGRKILVLLDNADSIEQVRPLLAATPGCLTLITSRHRLSGLLAYEGAHRIGLDVLPVADARELLDALVGSERTAVDEEQVTALIERCSGLPLALRVAAAQLVDEPHRSVGDYVAELDERGVAMLALDDDHLSAVAAAFDTSYRRLDPATQRFFRLLGLVPGPSFSIAAAAAMSGVPVLQARELLRRIAGAHLVAELGAGRYRFHDLLRGYAQARAADDEPPQARRDALERLFAWYYLGKSQARDRLVANRRDLQAPAIPVGIPEVTFDDNADADAWLTAELDNIAAAVWTAHADEKLRPWAWHLTVGLAVMMTNRGFVSVVLPLTHGAVDAARSANDVGAIAHSLIEQGTVRHLAGLPVPDDLLAEALQLTERLGDAGAFGYCLNLAGIVHFRKGDLDAAEAQLRRALKTYERAGDIGGQCLTLNNLGAVLYGKGDLGASTDASARIVELLGDEITDSTPITLAHLILNFVMLGRFDEIPELAIRARDAATQVADPSKSSRVWFALARWHRELGQIDAAMEEALTAKRLADDVGQPHLQTEPRDEVGRCHLARGDVDAALTEFAEAKALADAQGSGEQRSAAASALAEASAAGGELEAAESFAREAVQLARGIDRISEAEATTVLARVLLAADQLAAAVAEAETALEQHRAIGSVLGETRTLRVLGEALVARNAPGDAARGESFLNEATTMVESFGS